MTEPKKKSQHFVPRFYLRNFSFDGGNRLHLIHARDLRAIPQIGLKSQCAEDYFYGKDPKVENALQDLEGATADIIRNVLASRQLPARSSPDDFVLRAFLCLQWGRTRSHAEHSAAMFDKMLKTAYGPEWRAQGITQEQIDEVYFGTEYPGLYSLGMSSETVPFVGDLESKLVLASDLGEFVTSDAPVVLYNPYLLGRYPGGVTGLNVRGLVIFFPLSPSALAVFYDSSVYRVGPPHARVVPLGTRPDLVALNNFQFLHADDAVYYCTETSAVTHQREFSQVARMRQPERAVVQEAFSTRPGDNSSLLMSYRKEFPYRPPLSFLSLKRDRRGETGAVDHVEERNAEISALFDRYQADTRAGSCDRGFLNYYTAHLFGQAAVPLPRFLRQPGP